MKIDRRLSRSRRVRRQLLPKRAIAVFTCAFALHDLLRRELSAGLLVGLLAGVLSGCASQTPALSRPAGVDKYALGVREAKAGDRDGAIRDLNDATRINPKLRMARVVLGDVYRTNGDYARAAEQYEVAARLDPYSPANHYNLGVCYQFLHRLEDAASAYLNALNLEPQDLKANMNLGIVYLSLGKTEQAQKYLHRATVIDPKSPQAWTNYGVSLDAQSRYPEAADAYRKALELDSASISALGNLAANLISQKKAQDAIVICQQLLLRVDSPGSRSRYGDALALSRQYDAASQQYDIALKRDKQYYPALAAKGFLLIQQYEAGAELDEGLRANAVDLWKASLRMNSDQPKVLDAIQKWEK